MDLVMAETIKLIKLNYTAVNIGFHNKKMVKIFLDNLNASLEEQQIEKDKKVEINITVMA
jgi:hypothetical protein